MKSRETYIIAVSGGVDSVVLLHKLVAVKPPHINYIVAHFDHGIRTDSSSDAKFVKKLAKKYQTPFEFGRGNLGSDTSEDEARKARYDFLFSVKKKHRAVAIITAHHQDDILETMVVNILRGTSPRGLIGFTMPGIIRPLMNRTKQQITDYADKYGLEWHEDSTNNDQNYLRNYVRINLMPKITLKRRTLLEIRGSLVEKYYEIDSLTKKILVQSTKKGDLLRAKFVVLPHNVQKELMATMLRMRGIEIDRKMVERSVIAVKTLLPGKHIELTKGAKLLSGKKSVKLT